MEFNIFFESLQQSQPPAGINIYLLAMWQDGKGDWTEAHNLVDSLEDKTACRVHAYLHRKEGDIWNADYWYRKAGVLRPAISLDEEWELVVKGLL